MLNKLVSMSYLEAAAVLAAFPPHLQGAALMRLAWRWILPGTVITLGGTRFLRPWAASGSLWVADGTHLTRFISSYIAWRGMRQKQGAGCHTCSVVRHRRGSRRPAS